MMKITKLFRAILICLITGIGFNSYAGNPASDKSKDTAFSIMADRFADIQMLRYEVPGFDKLTVNQKKLSYYLTQAGLAGRDIFYDQKNKNNLTIRKTLEAILNQYSKDNRAELKKVLKGDQGRSEWKSFTTYCKQFFFSNGMHHHYSSDKIIPTFSKELFATLINGVEDKNLPTGKMSKTEFVTFVTKVIFDPTVDPKLVNLSAADVIKGSANNFYENVTQAEVEGYYERMKKENPNNKSQFGLNTKTVKENGKITEKVWKSGGMYGQAIDEIIKWLNKAMEVAENPAQKRTLELLVKFYKTGDPVDFDNYSISWVEDTVSSIDFVNGFIEVYQDALQRKGSYESIVSMRDEQATKRIAAISHEAQWFEDHSPILPTQKKKNVKGISAKVITIIGEVGDAAPSTPIGINLPNNEWIREEHGSKSVSLGNIVASYNYYKAKTPMIDEFGSSKEVKERARKYLAISSDLHTDMHEVIGHASGKINDGVGTTEETLKNYAGVLEEARADLVGLYFVMDQKLIDIGVMPSLEAGKAQYDYYILNGLMTQLQRIEHGKNLEEAHMRNRQLVASWAYEHGLNEKVIYRENRENKTYFVINDYNKLRELFGQLLKEIQRIKSEGDFNAGKNLVETYGVKVDQQLRDEVQARYDRLNIAPYLGFIQADLVPVMKGNDIVDVKIEYPKTFLQQMLDYGNKYSYLPARNY